VIKLDAELKKIQIKMKADEEINQIIQKQAYDEANSSDPSESPSPRKRQGTKFPPAKKPSRTSSTSIGPL